MIDTNDKSKNQTPVGPYESLRNYIDAIEACGQALHISGLDQDAYEATGFMYRLIDKLGWADAPAVIFKKIKINGKWHEGPVIANQYGRWQFEGLAFGVDPGNAVVTTKIIIATAPPMPHPIKKFFDNEMFLFGFAGSVIAFQ